MKTSEDKQRLLGLAPGTITMLVFLVIPMCFVLVFTFLKKGPYGGVLFEFSTDSYMRLLFMRTLDDTWALNSTFLVVLWRSLFLGVMTTLTCAVISFPVAYWISRLDAKWKNICLILIMIPFWSNLLVRTTAWIVLLREPGVINNLLIGLGLVETPLKLLYTNSAVLLGLVYVYIPFMIFPIYTSIERLDLRLLEAGFDLYASRWRVFTKVIFPLTMPGVIAGCVLVFVPSIGAFITPDLLGGGKKLMFGNLIHLQFTTARNWPYGSVISVLLLTFVMCALYGVARHKARFQER